jgi:hypothetical protein
MDPHANTVVDADGHIMEPADMWITHVDPPYREDAIRIVRDADDGDKLLIQGRPSRRVRRLGGIRPPADGSVVNWDALDHLERYESYGDSCLPASYDARSRLRWMDERDIEAAFLFPSLGLIWPQEVQDAADYMRAHMAAYNRWILEFADFAPERLVPIAQVALFEPEQTVADLDHVRHLGFEHIMLPLSPAGTVSCFHSSRARVWDAVQDLGLTVHLHKVAIPHHLNVAPGARLGVEGVGAFFNHVNEVLAGQMCLTAIMDNRLPDLHPAVRFAFLECNAGWLGPWLDRTDETFEVLSERKGPLLKEPPRYYLADTDRFFFGLGPNEDVQRLRGLERGLMVATDFPHPGFSPDPLRDWSARLAALESETSRMILRGNALRLRTRDQQSEAVSGR